MPTNGQFVTNLEVIAGDAPTVSPLSDWYKIPADLSCGAGGKFAYLFFKRGDDSPIHGLFVISGNNSGISGPPGCEKIPVDLNMGAGRGRYIYLCYTRNPQLGQPVKEVAIITGGSSSILAPAGYTKINQDLNEGVGAHTSTCTTGTREALENRSKARFHLPS